MILSQKHTYKILSILVGTVLVCWALGAIRSEQVGISDDGLQGLSTIFGLALGVIAAVIGLVTGAVVHVVSRKNQQDRFSSLGYIVPCMLAVICMIVLVLSPS